MIAVPVPERAAGEKLQGRPRRIAVPAEAPRRGSGDARRTLLRHFEAIALQSHEKAEKFHNMVFESQAQMKDKGEKLFAEIAKKLGVDMKKLEADLKSDAVTKNIDSDMAEAKKFNMSGTPGFIINGVALRGAYPFSEFKTIIDQHLAAKN